MGTPPFQVESMAPEAVKARIPLLLDPGSGNDPYAIVRPPVSTSMSSAKNGVGWVPLSMVTRPSPPEARVQVARSGQGRLGSEERQRRTERHGDHGAHTRA